ncbi:LuxR C-terminal-related transcriptional regulator [Streptomyces sp. Je 1-79]|uniref:helix-turn-helix transcriptional regulator n=1 Tax=Streptomyces sp. Je 1-79 TaxID=2943847 RepID=UPI0021A4B45E|nr:LuxR C-terminal-related transcriptional regulator [Streptomyces sp. Je 1-79]MCT4357657.1 LuxR C-terminal-related transcriptional regulator [Streptomyces sp. Je 1-79]
MRAGVFVRNQLALLGIRCLLDAEADIQVAFATGTPFAVAAGAVDCLVLDLGLLDELPEPPWGTAGVPAARTVLLTADTAAGRELGPDRRMAETHLFDDAPLLLVDAIRRVAGPGPAPAGVGPVARQGVATLSPREREVLRHLVEGCTHDQAARRIGISQHTVDTYVKRIRSKLGAHNKAQLVRAALTAPRAQSVHLEPAALTAPRAQSVHLEPAALTAQSVHTEPRQRQQVER